LDSCRESAFEESGLEAEADDRDYTTPTKIEDRIPEHLVKRLGLKPSPVKDIYVMEPKAADEGVAFQPPPNLPPFEEVNVLLPRGFPNETTSVEVQLECNQVSFDFCVCSF
jgi:hypothetical protein